MSVNKSPIPYGSDIDQILRDAKKVAANADPWEPTEEYRVTADQNIGDFRQRLDASIVTCPCGKACIGTVCHTKDCRWCGREMRAAGTKRKSGGKDVVYGGRGYCVSHYETVYKFGEGALEEELDRAVESYWFNRKFVLAGVEVTVGKP